MVPHDAHAIACGEPVQVNDPCISVQVAWTSQSRFQQTLVSDALTSPVLGQNFSVIKQERQLIDPNRFIHLASSRSVSRYSFMISSLNLICSATEGSYGVRR